MDKNNEKDRPVLDRVNTEYSELGEKIDKLAAFIQSGIFNDLDGFDRTALVAQLGAMKAYHGILFMRLNDAGYFDD